MDDLTKVVILHKYHESMTENEILKTVGELTQPEFSARMMVKVTGLPMSKVLPAMGKTARTGGRLNPDTLPDIVTLREHGLDPDLVRSIVRRGTSQLLLARLLGKSQPTIWRTINGTDN